MEVAQSININIPEKVAELGKPAQLQYLKAFESVFKFIQSTGKLCPENQTELIENTHNHLQSIFLAKYGGVKPKSVDLKNSFEKIINAAGLEDKDKKDLELQLNNLSNNIDINLTEEKMVEEFSKADLGFILRAVLPNAESIGEYLPSLNAVSSALSNLKTLNGEPADNGDLQAKAIRNTKIAQLTLEAVEEIEDLKKVNPRLSSSAINTVVQAKFEGVELYTSDVKQIQACVKDKYSSVEQATETQNDIQNFLEKNGKWLIMLFPVIAAPLAKVFSHIPFLGRPLNALLGQVSSNAGTLITVLASSALNGSKEAPPPKREAVAAEQMAQST